MKLNNSRRSIDEQPPGIPPSNQGLCMPQLAEVKYQISPEVISIGDDPFSTLVLNETEFSKNKLCYSDANRGVWLYQANCLELMDRLIEKYPHGRFSCIFADPPYFLSNGGFTCHAGRMVKVDKGKWDKSQGSEINHEFNLAWIDRCRKLLLPDGTLWVTGTHHVIFSVGFAMQQLGMKILNDIAWEKPNPPPNLSCRYFTHSTETLLWAAKSEKSKHYFDYPAMRAENDGKQMKTVWRMKSPANSEKTFGKHPTQKPLSLLQRIITASTKKGELVLDPFSGSATTGVACLSLGRRFVGIEQEQEYINLAIQRLERRG